MVACNLHKLGERSIRYNFDRTYSDLIYCTFVYDYIALLTCYACLVPKLLRVTTFFLEKTDIWVSRGNRKWSLRQQKAREELEKLTGFYLSGKKWRFPYFLRCDFLPHISLSTTKVQVYSTVLAIQCVIPIDCK